MDYPAIFAAVREAANKAAHAANEKLPPENARGFDCGFAWLQITPGTHPFVRWLREQGGREHGSKHWDKGWQIWGSSLHDVPTQSIGVHEAAARAAADYLREALKSDARADFMVGSRYD